MSHTASDCYFSLLFRFGNAFIRIGACTLAHSLTDKQTHANTMQGAVNAVRTAFNTMVRKFNLNAYAFERVSFACCKQ